MNARLSKFALCLSLMTSMVVGMQNVALAGTHVPDDQKAAMTLTGSGVSPNSDVFLISGGKQRLATKSSNNGEFSFQNLQYLSYSGLKFSLVLPPYNRGIGDKFPANSLDFSYDPTGAMIDVQGNIGRSGSIAVDIVGADQSAFKIAGDGGFVRISTPLDVPIYSGFSQVMVNIINAGEVCCPKMTVPSAPVILTLSSVPIQSAPAVKAPQPAPVPYIAPVVPKNSVPVPKPAPLTPPENKQPPKKAPYLVIGKVETVSFTATVAETSYAVSFPDSAYQSTWVGGLKQLTREMRNGILFRMASLGAMLDGREAINATRSLQVLNQRTLKDYTISDTICRFGTLSKSEVYADSTRRKNQLAFSKLMTDRDTQKMNSLYSAPAQGISAALEDFQGKYCNPSDNGGFMDGYCKVSATKPDALYNRDVDFTRVFDVPLTLDADFTDTNVTADKQAVIALFHNLSLAPPNMDGDSDGFDPRSNMLAAQDFRAASALRSVTANSFAALVGEKVKAKGAGAANASSSHMQAVLVQLGLSATDAKKLVGDNPSYFAQMEVMTKKLFQDPAFYANLYDSEPNVDRQRVAMKAVELQQDRDLLESLRRREMLLSVLLNSKLRKPAADANSSGINVKSN